MLSNEYGWRRMGVVAALLFGTSVLPSAAVSEQISLKSTDGTIDFTGEFLGFDEGIYIVRTALGDLRVRADRVDCDGSACATLKAADATVRFAGSSAFGLGIMPLLLEGYGSHQDAEVAIEESENRLFANYVSANGFGDESASYYIDSTVSGTAFEALLSGSVHFGMSSRRITPNEARALLDAGAGSMISPAQEHIIAIDSLVVITHPSNAVSEISMEQLADIFAGRTTNWSELGGEDTPIKVINRQTNSGTRLAFYDAIFGDQTPTLRLANEDIAQTNQSAARMVNEDPGAIGFVGYAFQRGAKPLKLINECGMSTEPDAFAARVEEYALQRRLYLYNRSEGLTEAAEDFLAYAKSEAADDVIAKTGFIDLGIKRKTQELNGARARMLLDPKVDAYEGGVMRQMLAEMVNFDRLSTTFRFRTGSSKLDERGALDMRRLANYLETKPKGTKVMFVGFTDNVGSFDGNRRLSISRARKVAAQLRAFSGNRLDGIEFSSTGFGEIAPATCNNSENGRSVNRRVEVWIETDRRS